MINLDFDWSMELWTSTHHKENQVATEYKLKNIKDRRLKCKNNKNNFQGKKNWLKCDNYVWIYHYESIKYTFEIDFRIKHRCALIDSAKCATQNFIYPKSIAAFHTICYISDTNICQNKSVEEILSSLSYYN